MRDNKHSLRSVVRKILAAFLLGSVAIVLAMAIARLSFQELMVTVDDLSKPDEKVTLLNAVFEKITTLDQVQRAEAIENPKKPYSTFIEQSVSINQMIDSLQTFKWDTAQQNKLNAMKGILDDRNKLFFSYLKVKAELMENKEFSIQLDTLALILAADEITLDSSLVTSQKKTTTTFFRDTTKSKTTAQQRSFLKRIFSKKKPAPVDTPKIKVQEELTYVVDTTAMAKQLAAVAEIERIMKAMETDQRNQRKRLQRQELELINTNSQLINQLLNILHTVENEELASMRRTNDHAVAVMNQSISRINILVLAFFLAAALLVYLIWIDIGKSNYYKQQLEQAKDRAEELSQIKQRFLANMSHEIRTPLQSIIGFAEQLKQKSNSRQDELEAIYSSSEHLLHIVNEVLDYSRISSGNFNLSKEKFKLLQLIREVEAAMRVQSERKNLTFILDLEEAKEVSLFGDPFRLRQILYNLIGNAVKFTHKGFVKLVVRTMNEGNLTRCNFEVIDTGIGIEKNEINKIFNQFEQANGSVTSNYGGTGLGLTIVKSLIDAQGGEIEVSSEPGIGTSFRFQLDFERVEPVAEMKPAAILDRTIGEFEGKVMVIDDDTLILRLCSLIFKKNGIDYTTFNHGKSLLNEAADKEVTHIFMDIRMPDINGLDLCRALRKKYSSSVRFIALTAHVLPEERQSLLQQGFDSVLTKPFHEQQLIDMLHGESRPSSSHLPEQPDLSLLKQMTMGDETLFQSIVTQFVDETMDDVLRVKDFLKTEDALGLREVIHKMAGRFSQLGMKNIGSKLQAVEKQLVAGATITEVSNEVSGVSKNVNDMVKQIRLTTMHLN
jgi:signal transduction histidine kinase/FixJ family two-component response regulator